VSSGIAPLTYLWSWGDGTYDSVAYPSHTYANAGYYTICLYIQDSTGCTDSICNSYQLQKMLSENTIVTVNVVPDIPTTIQNNDVLQSWSVFPNPVQEEAFVNYTLTAPANVSIDLYDVLEKHVYGVVNFYEQPGKYNASIDTHKLGNGIYVLRLRAGEQVVSQKIAVVN
jgi:PKD repeat protein